MANSSTSPDSFGARGDLQVGAATYEIHRIGALADRFDVARLPYSIKVILENLLRHEDGLAVTASDIEAVAGWGVNPERHGVGGSDAAEIALTPERVLMQDLTGVPGVVDLAAMRDALRELGGDPAKVNPLVPVEMVVDHSVIAEASGTATAYDQNVDIEYHRNIERYQLLRWAQQAFDGFRVVPPGMGICHQVNLEYLSRVVFATEDGRAYCDTLVGTDSHTTMVNGLGVLGWGVGGIEAEAAMLGQPLSLLLPPVVGFRLTGEQPAGTTATDLVLTITNVLRKVGVVGKFVEFFGPGVASVPLANRATIGNMSPEYGATCAMFPIDDVTLDYLRFSGRDDHHVDLVEAYAKAQGMFLTADSPEPVYSAGDRARPGHRGAQHRRAVAAAGPGGPRRGGPFVPHRARPRTPGPRRVARRWGRRRDPRRPRGGGRHHLVHQHLEPPGHGGGRPGGPQRGRPGPGRQALGQDDTGAGLTGRHGLPGPGRPHRAAGRRRVRPGRLRLHHLHRQFRPAPPGVSEAVQAGDLSVTSVLSGNRNFEGRIHPDVRMNYLASPPLVVAYALAGTMDLDLTSEPIGTDRDGRDVFLADLWPTPEEVTEAIRTSLTSDMFRQRYSSVFEGDERWRAIGTATGDTFSWDPSSTYVLRPTFLQDLSMTPAPVTDVVGARVLAKLGDSVTTDHISPAGNIKPTTPGRPLPAPGTASSRWTSTRTGPAGATTRSWSAGPSPTSASATSWLRAPRAGSPCTSPMARRPASSRPPSATRPTASRWWCWRARSTDPARRATGRPRGPACWVCGRSSPSPTSASTGPT